MKASQICGKLNRFTVTAIVILIFLLCSTDLRIGLNFEIDARPSFQFFEFAIIPLLAISLVLLPFKIQNIRLMVSKEDFIIVLFVVYVFLEATTADDVPHSVSRAKDFLLASYLYFFIKYSPMKIKQLKVVLFFIVFIALLWSVIGICQWLGFDKDFGGDIYSLFLAKHATDTKFIFLDDKINTFAHGLYLFPQNFIYYLVYPFAISVSFIKDHKLMVFPSALIFIAMVGTISKTFVIIFALYILYRLLHLLFRNCYFTNINLIAYTVLVLLNRFPFPSQL